MWKILSAVKRGVSRQPKEIKSILAFQCSKNWDELQTVEGNRNVRFCDSCSNNVYLTESDLAYTENLNMGRCVSIPKGTKLRIKGKEVTTTIPVVGGVPSFPRD